MLRQILNFQSDHGSDLDELVALAAFGATVKAQYEGLKMTPPQQFGENLTAIEKELKTRRKDNIERALREARARKEALKTMDEKRLDLDKSIAALEASLAEG